MAYFEPSCPYSAYGPTPCFMYVLKNLLYYGLGYFDTTLSTGIQP